MGNFCGPHSTILDVNSTREGEMCFICPKQIVKPVMLLFHLTEYQIHKVLARVEVRRFQFLVILQFVWIPLQGYFQCSPDTSVRHSYLSWNFFCPCMCRNHRYGLHRLLYCCSNSSGCWGASSSWKWCQRTCSLKFLHHFINAEDIIGLLASHMPFMKQYPSNGTFSILIMQFN